MDKSLLMKARAMLEEQTPMRCDCGVYCDAACCQSDDEGQGGVFLFPGEEELIGGSWAQFLDSEEALSGLARMVVCSGECDRKNRPLGCMIFPLTPKVSKTGSVSVDFDYRARPLCPLLRDGVQGLRFEFTEAVRAALNLVAQDSEGLAFLRAWQALEEKYHFSI